MAQLGSLSLGLHKRSLVAGPPEVVSDRVDPHHVDFLPGSLPDVADVRNPLSMDHRHGLRKPEAQISSRPGSPTYGLSEGMEYGCSAIDADSDHLAEKRVQVSRPVARVVGPPTVTQAEIEIAIRAEVEEPAVVVVGRLVDASS